ncbi:NAD-dependent epimerase/dehydratase family protein [Variovorax sp. VNK109]|uniref:NAD-dependent epimerase/dehydratase family protein n=1 Tax=Variovorax sp. VNK109 TaxID=3400919 RepID=UPI003C10822F
MPSNQSPLGALPARFRRERILIVGCGDVGLRAARVLTGANAESRAKRPRVLALTSSPGRHAALRGSGIVPLSGNLDDVASLRRLAGIATRVLHLAPPPSDGEKQWWRDPRTQALLNVLKLRVVPAALVYGSTSGVYGDCGGARVAESRPANPRTPRALRRADAEHRVRLAGRTTMRTNVLRIPGIYAPDREGGTPHARLQRGTPVLRREDDVFTNHIHADDLARACVLALWRGKPQRVLNVNDDTDMRMGDYFDFVAGLYGMPKPPRVPRSQAEKELSLAMLSFMGESRRMDNTRLKRELRLALHYPTVREGLVPLRSPPA